MGADRVRVYAGFPAIATLTAGDQLVPHIFIRSIRFQSLNNGGQLQEKAAEEVIVVSIFSTL